MLVNVFELVGGAVFIKFHLPGGIVEGRQGSGNGLPFGDRQARLGQPGDTAQYYLNDDHRHTQQEPISHLPLVFLLLPFVHRQAKLVQAGMYW